MLSQGCLQELQNHWLPHITEPALNRLVDLIEKNSPLLIHGSFTQAIPQGCLATHVGWNHPKTAHLEYDAGIVWLQRVAGLNPSHSQVIREWDCNGPENWSVRQDLLILLKEEQKRRLLNPSPNTSSPSAWKSSSSCSPVS